MRPMLKDAAAVFTRFPIVSSKAATSSVVSRSRNTPFVCLQCQHRAASHSSNIASRERIQRRWRDDQRAFSWTARRRDVDTKKVAEEKPTQNIGTPDPEQREPLKHETLSKSGVEDVGTSFNSDELPSHRERLRSQASKYVNQLMDDLMPKLALASQRINTYTGTDYTGIDKLRKDILEQEQLVKSHQTAVFTAKEALETARTAESQSRKEVVALLERRHSWSDTDLERYMSLIRSEHINDQAVQTAKDRVADCERVLEETRSKLERMERAKYHEEQIWSDTIRRNSTWVTFGLMGFNILILLVTMGIVEPWRRKRMVREIKSALEENKNAAIPAKTTLPMAAADAPAVEPPSAQAIGPLPTQPLGGDQEAVTQEVEPHAVVVDSTPSIPLSESTPRQEPNVSAESIKPDFRTHEPSHPAPQVESQNVLEQWQATMKDLFSERVITIRQVEVSTIALEGVAAGAAIAMVIVALLRPR